MIILFLSQYSFSIQNLVKAISDALSDKTLFTTLIGIIASLGIIISFSDTIRNFFDTSMEVDLNKCLTSPDYEIHTEFIQKLHHDFANIVSAYSDNSRVYIFIDDLDRCDIPKAVELMRAINMLIDDSPNLIFIIGMDRTKIAAGIAAKNEKLLPYLYPNNSITESANTSNLSLKGLEYGFEFIEKFIQIPFLVPQPDEKSITEFLDKLNSCLPDEKTSPKANQLDEDDYEEINKSSNRILDEEFKDLLACEKIETGEEDNSFTELISMVSDALDNNPRRLKQFINLLRLKLYISMETNLFVYNKKATIEKRWNTKKLAKFIAISIKWPLLITHLASNKALFHYLQKIALNQQSTIEGIKDNSKLTYWSEQTKLIELLKYGCFNIDESFNSENAKIYSLDELDYDKLLIVSPIVKLPLSNISKIPKSEEVSDAIKEDAFNIIRDSKEGIFQNEL